MSTTRSPDCVDSNFNFKHGWSYTGILVVIICGLCVFIDAIRHREKRKVPGKLMMSRTFVDVLWALIFFYMISDVDCDFVFDHPKTCDFLGTSFTFLFLLSLMYFSGICWDMYFTLVNPFRRPISDSWQLHLFSIVVSCLLSLIVTINHGYKYRQDYQICWTQNTSTETSPNNLIILYLPLGTVIVGGLLVTIWAIKRLKQRMLEETFELRWSVIKRQIAIVSLFTINYVIAGCIWWPIVWITFTHKYGAYGANPTKQPYLLSVTIVLTVVFDLIAWIAKDSFAIYCNKIFKNPIKSMITSSTHTQHSRAPIIQYYVNDKAEPLLLNESNSVSLAPHSHSQSHSQSHSLSASASQHTDLNKTNSKVNLSKALRREVIVFITHGIAQSIKRTAKETQDAQNNNNLDVYDADFDYTFYSTNRSITGPALSGKKLRTKQSNPDLIQQIVYVDDAYDSQYYHSLEDEDENLLNQPTPRDETINYLTICEPAPQKVYFADSIRRNPGENRGAMDRFNIEIPGSHLSDDYVEPVPFTDFAPHVFRYLRGFCYGVTDINYLESILPNKLSEGIIGDIVAKFSEGRSGAFFFYTKDNKYLIKTLNTDEAQLLLQILPNYLEYFKSNPGSYLTKFFGLHSIKLYSLVIYFVVMENVFPSNTEPQETYDLKGSWIARHTNHHQDEGKLMKDEDLHKQLLLNKAMSSNIYAQLYADTQFLENEMIMDYSLLLGIYYMGIDPESIENTKKEPKEPKEEQEDSEEDEAKAKAKEKGKVQVKEERKWDAIISTACDKHFYRSRAGTYHTVTKHVGNTKTAIKAKVIEGPGIYYIAVIDILQKWNASKRLEKLFKVYFRCMNKDGVSCVEPSYYRRRFLRKMQYIGIRPQISTNKNFFKKK